MFWCVLLCFRFSLINCELAVMSVRFFSFQLQLHTMWLIGVVLFQRKTERWNRKVTGQITFSICCFQTSKTIHMYDKNFNFLWMHAVLFSAAHLVARFAVCLSFRCTFLQCLCKCGEMRSGGTEETPGKSCFVLLFPDNEDFEDAWTVCCATASQTGASVPKPRCPLALPENAPVRRGRKHLLHPETTRRLPRLNR